MDVWTDFTGFCGVDVSSQSKLSSGTIVRLNPLECQQQLEMDVLKMNTSLLLLDPAVSAIIQSELPAIAGPTINLEFEEHYRQRFVFRNP